MVTGQGHQEEGHHHQGDTEAGQDLPFVTVSHYQSPQKEGALEEDSGIRLHTCSHLPHIINIITALCHFVSVTGHVT